jgi:hypothetical protein
MATIGSLSVNIDANTTGLATGLKTSESMVAGFSAKASQLTDKLIAVGPAAIAAGAAIGVVMVKNFIDAADKLTDLSERTGIAVDDLSRLGYVAQMSGISADEMTGAIVKLSNTMAMASVNGGTASRVFDVLGVSVKNTDGTLRSQVDVLKDVADKFASYEDGAAKTALAVQLFGKSGANLIPVLNAGAEGIQAMSDESDKLGNTINTRTAQAAAEFNDNLDRLAVLSGNAAQSLSESLLPSLVSITDAMIEGIQNAQQYGNVFTGMLDELTNRAMQSTSPMLRFLAIFREAQAIQENTGFRGKDFEDPRKVSGQTAAPVVDDEAAKAREAEAEARAKELEQIREHELAKVQAFIDALKLREEARVAATMTEQEAEAERYLLEQEKLLEALELGLITKGEYQLMEQEALMNHRQIMADIDMNALDEQLAREKAAADERVRIEQQAQEMISSARLAAANAAVGLLSQLGGKNKAAAIAAIALGKALSIGQIIQNTAVAQMKALATLGPVAGPAAASKIGMYGKIQAGLVAATGLAQVAGAMSGDSGGITASASSSAAGTSGGGGGGGGGGGSMGGMGGTAAAQGQTVNIQLQGEIFGREQVRSLITQINEAVADGSVLRIE